jgi:hypothetical protein
MATLANPTVVDLLSEEAGRIAVANPPSRVFAIVVLGVFFAVGWVIGSIWRFCEKSVIFIALAARLGYRRGARVPVEPRTAPAQ